MKCPNCGNEAINVNGKFVCLDCGIEISGNEQTATTPQVGNHTEPEPIAVGEQSVPVAEPNFFTNTKEKVITPPPSETGPSLKEQYLAELEREEKTQNTGVFDFSAPASGSTPDFPVGTDAPIAEASVQTTSPTPVVPVDPPASNASIPSSLDFDALSNISAPVADPLNVPAQTGATTTSIAEEPEAVPEAEDKTQETSIAGAELSSIEAIPEVTPQAEISMPQLDAIPTKATIQPTEASGEVPELTSVISAAAEKPVANPFDVSIPPLSGMGDPVPAQEAPQEPEQVTAPAETSEAPVKQSQAEVFNPANEEEEVEIPINKPLPAPEPQASEAPAPEPASYFQPASVNITPQAEPSDAPIPQKATETSESLGQAPLQEAENIEAENFVSPEIPSSEPINMTSLGEAVPTEVQAAEVNLPSPDLDTLLDKYSATGSTSDSATQGGSVDSVRSAPFSNYNLSKEAPVVPGSDSIPSVSSVFEDGYVDPNPAIEEKAKKNKKVFVIVGIVVAVLLVFGAIAAFFVASMNAQNQERAKIQQFEKAVMEGVPGKIEGDQNMRVTYRDAINFSKLSIKPQAQEAAAGQELLKLFAAPFISEGNWEANTEKNIAQNSRVNGQSFIRVYVDAEKMTYVSDGGSWKKLEGRQIVGVPAFFNPVERGSLFYSSKVEKLIYQKKITGTEKTLYEFKVVPKQELLREAILGTSILFAKAKVENIDASNLTILVQIDEEKNLHNVIVKGDVAVTADLFEGTVSFDSFADYLYTQVEIQKPEMALLDKKQV